MTQNTDNLWEGWWRWPLVPIASIVGAFLGSAAFMLIQWFSLKYRGGYEENGWYFQYVLPLLKDAVFGFLIVYLGCLVAPRGKLIVGVVLTTLVGALWVALAFYSINYIPEHTIRTGLLPGVATFGGSLLGVILANKD